MRTHPHIPKESGFSAVELLITLFIAVAFIAAGYQLYSAVIGDGGLARSRAIASNIAYENLREVAGNTNPSPCQPPPATIISSPAMPPNSNLDNPVISAVISAPNGCGASDWKNTVMLVQITITYGPTSNRQQVMHAIYVNK
jgi:hypothetical protein